MFRGASRFIAKPGQIRLTGIWVRRFLIGQDTSGRYAKCGRFDRRSDAGGHRDADMMRGLDSSSYRSGIKLERESHRNPVVLENIAKDNKWATPSRKQKAYVAVWFHRKNREEQCGMGPSGINKK